MKSRPKAVLLRLPKTLHRVAKKQAESEGVSLNTFLVTLISQGTVKVAADHLRAKKEASND